MDPCPLSRDIYVFPGRVLFKYFWLIKFLLFFHKAGICIPSALAKMAPSSAAKMAGDSSEVDDRTTSLNQEEKDYPLSEHVSQAGNHDIDPFGNEEFADVQYRTLTWW